MREVAEDLFNKCPWLEENHTQKNDYNNSYASGANTTVRIPHQNYNNQNHLPQPPQHAPANYDRNSWHPSHCPALTDEERSALTWHQGCFKCRLPYVPHITCDCPNDFPTPENYEVHTDAWCLCRKPNTVASIHTSYNLPHTFENPPKASSSQVQADRVLEMPPHSRVAILPSVNFLLEKDNNDCYDFPSLFGYVPSFSPYHSHHTSWLLVSSILVIFFYLFTPCFSPFLSLTHSPHVPYLWLMDSSHDSSLSLWLILILDLHLYSDLPMRI